MSEKFEHDDAQKGPTFDDPGKNYNDIPGVEYEDHFLMYKRAGNHAAYLQKVIEYAEGGHRSRLWDRNPDARGCPIS